MSVSRQKFLRATLHSWSMRGLAVSALTLVAVAGCCGGESREEPSARGAADGPSDPGEQDIRRMLRSLTEQVGRLSRLRISDSFHGADVSGFDEASGVLLSAKDAALLLDGIEQRLDRFEGLLQEAGGSLRASTDSARGTHALPKNGRALAKLSSELDTGALQLVPEADYERVYKELRERARRRVFGASCSEVYDWLGLPDSVSGKKWIYCVEGSITISILFFDGFAVDVEIR